MEVDCAPLEQEEAVPERVLRWLAKLQSEEELRPIAPVPIVYPPVCQRHREVVRGVASSCCATMVYRQVYQRERLLPTATSGPAATLLKKTTVNEWFYECSRCEDRCNIELSVEASPLSQGLEYGTSEYIFNFIAWYRKQSFSAILPGTVVDGVVHRYVHPQLGDQRASIRTDQKRCPVRSHDKNSLVLRINLTRREFSVCCWCTGRPFDTRPLAIVDKTENRRLMDEEIRGWYKE